MLPPDSYDVVWSVECTEHLFDKPAFFRRAADWIRPGGRMAIFAWLAGEPPHSPDARQQIYDVCEGFLCPSLATMNEYCEWMRAAGLTVTHACDWTDRVLQTWEICLRRIRSVGMQRAGRGSSAATPNCSSIGSKPFGTPTAAALCTMGRSSPRNRAAAAENAGRLSRVTKA